MPTPRHELVKLLADCYPTPESARRVAAAAGLDTRRIPFHPAAVDNWSSIVDAAGVQEMLDKLLDVVREEHTGPEMRGKLSAIRAQIGNGNGNGVSIGRLPVTTTRLFGREKDLAWLDACWTEGTHVATVVAWGGVGKSALVNTWLARKRDKAWDGAERVFGWSFYSQGTDRLTSSDELIDVALRWFGDPDPRQGSAWDKGERLAGLVRRNRAILVLDGLEPLQWGPGVQQGRLKDHALEALLKDLGAQNMSPRAGGSRTS